jgi:hypothetical protein
MPLFSIAQSAYLPANNNYTTYQLQRLEIKSNKLADPWEFNTSSGFYRRQEAVNYVDSFNVSGVKLSKQDYFNLQYIQNDNFEYTNANTLSKKSLFGQIYNYKSTFFGVKEKDFTLSVNPVLYLFAGKEQNNPNTVIINNRGVEMRAGIGNKVGVYTRIEDEIFTPFNRVKDYYDRDTVLPGEAFLKSTDTTTFNYWRTSGYVTFNFNKHFDMQFGHGNNFIGNGYRSFYMSDISRPHLFARINTHVWKINYTNIYGSLYQFSPFGQGRKNSEVKRTYYSTQYLSINATKNLSLGFFQTILFYRDSTYQEQGFDLEYLNPIIFMKAVENGLNSPDKALIGADFKWNFLNHFSLYGQMVIAEFVLGNFGTGWVNNKYAIQAGIKYIDAFGISNLDFQYEYNFARPYMYTSYDNQNSYVNWNTPGAHLLGANFIENIGIIRYQPLEKLQLKASAFIYKIGLDTNGSNWGQDISKTYRSPPKQYDNYAGQGVTTNVIFTDFVASYMLFHNFFIDLNINYRSSESILPPLFTSKGWMIGMGVRWNMNERRWDY